MSFDANDPRWTAYVLGELSDEDRAEVEATLQADGEARQLVESIGATADLLTSELSGQPVPSLSDVQRKRIEKIAVAPVARKRTAMFALAGCTAAAAALVVLLLIPTSGCDQSPSQILRQLEKWQIPVIEENPGMSSGGWFEASMGR